ncbi:MAG TPA: glycosyltransferase family 9 protein [Phycisphaerales bacterium]|nr:glycosyltransferase family 9 protein [Phycisphaerales bacterium]
MPSSDPNPARPKRLLVVLPSWVGDTVMATPTLRVLREFLPGSLIGGLMRPGLDQLLAGSPFLDEIHVDRAVGMMGPKKVAAKIRHLRYDAALLLTNSFSTALVTRLSGIPRRIGYDRDGRGILLTERLTPPRRKDTPPYNRSATAPNDWAPIPAVDYYFALAQHLLRSIGIEGGGGRPGPLELVVTREEELAADDILTSAGLTSSDLRRSPLIMLNPGGNDEAKRWPPDRFAALAEYLRDKHNAIVLISGSPSETALADSIVAMTTKHAAARPSSGAAGGSSTSAPRSRIISLPPLGLTLASLKGLLQRCRLLVTNDTGPRHIAAALGVPVVSLFGPTDHRWTTIPFEDEVILTADRELPEEEVANDHPDRCRIENIGLGDTVAAANSLLASAATR